MAAVSGVIYRSNSKERVSYATVKAFAKEHHPVYAAAGEGGEFFLDLPDTGIWTLIVFEEESLVSKPIEINADEDLRGLKIYLDRLAGTEDEKAGTRFFWVLVGVFIGLIGLYLLLHLMIIETSSKGFEFWTASPLRYLEILFWGLFGILVSKIITVGWYLRKHRYYKEGKIMHLSQIFTTPILVLVIVLLLSQVDLTFTLADQNTVNLNLAEPAIMVAFAFIIGTVPWPLWNFIKNSAEQFIGKNE